MSGFGTHFAHREGGTGMQSGTAHAAKASRLATAEEAEQAIQQLTDVDYFRLVKVARLLIGGSSYGTAEDLAAEAIQTPYLAARGEGGRRWPKDVDFMAYLVQTMRGLASDSRKSATCRSTVSNRVPSRDGPDEHDLFDQPRFSSLSPEESAIEAEDEEDCQQADDSYLAKIDERFKNDAGVQWIIRGLKEDKSPGEIQELSGMTKTQYESAQRRWRRGVEKLFPDRRDL